MDKDKKNKYENGEVDTYREECEAIQYHDMNEYHNELAEEFADEF